LKAGWTPRRWIDDFWKNWTINWLKSWELKDSKNIVEIEEKVTEEGIKKSSAKVFPKWTLLIAMYWVTAWEVWILWVDSSTNQAVCSIIPKIEVNKIYLYWILIFLRTKIRSETFWGAQPNISKEYLDNLQIPLPPLEIQNQIVEKMDEALRVKQEKEVQAKSLLASIDEFVLAELGIKYEEVEEKKVFGLSLSELGESKRLDPFFNDPSFLYFRDLKSKYDVKSIEEIILETKTWLPVRSDNRIENGEYPYYGANGIIWYMDEYTYDWDYIIVWQDWYIWNHYVVHWKFWASNHNWVMKLKEEINLYYVKSVLDVINYDYLVTGGVIPKLTREALMSIKIPLPPLEIQSKIADEVSARIEKAKRLEIEAREVYENAKREVESIVLES